MTESTRDIHSEYANLLCPLAYQLARSHFGGKAPDDSYAPSSNELFTVSPVDRLNITLRCDGRIRGSMSARGSTLFQQLSNAVEKALNDRRFGGCITASEVDRTCIEVWIQESSESIEPQERMDRDCLALGVEGIEVKLDDKQAYFKPSVAITRSFKTPQRMFSALCRKAGLEIDAWKNPEVSIKRTRWSCFFADEHREVQSELRGLRQANVPTRARPPLEKWLKNSCSYFRNNQFSNGEIAYLYSPTNNILSNEPLNLVRAAGCLYSLSTAIDSGLLSAASRHDVEASALALTRYLLNRSSPWKDSLQIIASPRSSRPPKLGATALTAAALSYPFLRTRFDNEFEALLGAVVSAQLPSGRFLTNFGVETENVRQSNFFSGQALLALALNREREELRKRYLDAFIPYRDHFRQAPTTAFTGWHIDLWARLAILEGNQEFADFTFELTDWLLQRQVTESSRIDWIGGFCRPGKEPSFSSIVFVEAVIRALQLAKHIGNLQKQSLYRNAALHGLQFCSQLRIDQVPHAFFPDPNRARGGVSLSLTDLSIRCDVVQHFITLCLAAHDNAELLFS